MAFARPTSRRSRQRYRVTASGGGLARPEDAGCFMAFDAKHALEQALAFWRHDNRVFPENAGRTDCPKLAAVLA